MASTSLLIWIELTDVAFGNTVRARSSEELVGVDRKICSMRMLGSVVCQMMVRVPNGVGNVV